MDRTKSLTICLLLALWMVAGLTSCEENTPREVEERHSFYHWRTRLALSEMERQWMDTLGGERLYVRFFDVDWQGNTAVPLAALEVVHWPKGVEIVPVVFITNRTLLELSIEEIPALAQQMGAKIEELANGILYPELQVDCDWTQRTQTAYFGLLESLRQYLPAGTVLSATIRLHQYRYPEQTGIPPVDRGMLMCYNMGQVDDPEETNSILNIAVTQPYIAGAPPYPIPMDGAAAVSLGGSIQGRQDGDANKWVGSYRLARYIAV
ncbi:MAG: hypothetical protein R2795_08535 [Saprospiraceae bacterium]